MQKLAVRLRPGAVACWLGVPAHELADRALSLEALLGSEIRELVERLGNASSRAAQRADLLQALTRRAARLEPPAALVEAALTRTHASRGRLATRTLARELGTSERQLERAFREHVGLGPKRFARIEIQSNDRCIGCGECTRYCQMGINVQKFAQQQTDMHNGNSSCIQCGICVQVCPMDVLSVGERKLAAQPEGPSIGPHLGL